MPMTRPPYSSGFREQMVELVRSGRSPEELAREFEPSAQSIRNWVGQADRDEGRSHDGLTSAEREELRRLRRENRRLRQEREILAKAAAWFARETGSIPSGSKRRVARDRTGGAGIAACGRGAGRDAGPAIGMGPPPATAGAPAAGVGAGAPFGGVRDRATVLGSARGISPWRR